MVLHQTIPIGLSNGNVYFQNFDSRIDNLSHNSYQVQLTHGAGPCHVNLDEENGILHVANYNGGSYIAFSINKTNGSIKERMFFENFMILSSQLYSNLFIILSPTTPTNTLKFYLCCTVVTKLAERAPNFIIHTTSVSCHAKKARM